MSDHIEDRKPLHPSPYTKNILAKYVVLSALRDGGTLTGDQLLKRTESARADGLLGQDFDFVRWAGTTFWVLLAAFVRRGFIVFGGTPTTPYEWRASTLSITKHGKRMLECAVAEIDAEAAKALGKEADHG